ncbi:MAG: sigma-54 dependent transcriptional regulator [Heliobacteriaceae bacterium]|nr:sigma-54 dependent transcriptional regulator [Heliobacteriaceae bacterium]
MLNILLVDDEQMSRCYLAEFLQKMDHQVVEAADGVEALAVLVAGDFHLVLTDIRMPRMSGLELLQQIRSGQGEQKPDVVLFTGYSEVETAVEALRAGAYDYLLKPINIKELVSVIERVTEHQALIRENAVLTSRFEVAVAAATAGTRQELSHLKKAYSRQIGLDQVGVFSATMKAVFAQAVKLHRDRSIPVLIEGETGTGKELIARWVHYGEEMVVAPFVDLNCAALAPNIFESELFGYEPGAFTGGLPKGQKGKLDLAAGGTLFLDEVAEIPVSLQAKLLRVLQEKEFFRVGGLKKYRTDARIICATNANIEKRVALGEFRRDLYYRLNVGRIYIPPLRQRRDDIIPLAEMFLRQLAREKAKGFRRISPAAAAMLVAHGWPGNVRELKNVIDWAVLMADDVELKPAHLGILPGAGGGPDQARAGWFVLGDDNFSLPDTNFSLVALNQAVIKKALQKHDGNKTRTAKYLGLSLRSLSYRLQKMDDKT